MQKENLIIDSDECIYDVYLCHHLQNKASTVHSEGSQCDGTVSDLKL